jgi:hypothetical protein
MHSTAFWVVTTCNSERARYFGGIYLCQLQDRRVSQARNQQEQVALKIEAICSSDTSGSLPNTRPYRPGNRTLQDWLGLLD